MILVTPALLCHKEPAQGNKSPYQRHFLPLAVSLWHNSGFNARKGFCLSVSLYESRTSDWSALLCLGADGGDECGVGAAPHLLLLQLVRVDTREAAHQVEVVTTCSPGSESGSDWEHDHHPHINLNSFLLLLLLLLRLHNGKRHGQHGHYI